MHCNKLMMPTCELSKGQVNVMLLHAAKHIYYGE